MTKRMWSVAALAALASALVLLTPGESHAQRRGFARGGIGIGGGYGYGNYGGLYGRGFGYGYPGIGYGGYGLGYNHYGLGYGSYGSYYSPSYYSYSPSYYGSDYAYNPQTYGYQSFYPQDSNYGAQPAYGNRGMVTVMVPADTEVWFDGTETQQRGPVRTFVTPPLEPNRTYTYQVRVKGTVNGQPLDQTRPLQVQAGRTATVDFNTPAPQNQDRQPNPPGKNDQ